jgi:hypothetical protein
VTSRPAEADLLAALDLHDDLVVGFASGQLSLENFLRKYDNFYWTHALDGHESDEAGVQLLESHARRIEPHRRIAEDVLAKLILVPSPAAADRIDPAQAESLLRDIAKSISAGEA